MRGGEGVHLCYRKVIDGSGGGISGRTVGQTRVIVGAAEVLVPALTPMMERTSALPLARAWVAIMCSV